MRNDPWALAGLALLALLTLGVVALYRAAPQSLEQARTGALVAARPDAFDPRLARAEERLRGAGEAADRGEDSVAVGAYAEAAEHAAAARAATEVWAGALLGWAEVLRRRGTGQGIRPDDEATLREALALVDRVLAGSPSPGLRGRAEAARDEIRRQLRIGPLEWLPLPR